MIATDLLQQAQSTYNKVGAVALPILSAMNSKFEGKSSLMTFNCMQSAHSFAAPDTSSDVFKREER